MIELFWNLGNRADNPNDRNYVQLDVYPSIAKGVLSENKGLWGGASWGVWALLRVKTKASTLVVRSDSPQGPRGNAREIFSAGLGRFWTFIVGATLSLGLYWGHHGSPNWHCDPWSQGRA